MLNKMKVLHLLSEKHKDWVNIVKSFGYAYPEDLVQDMYLKIYDWKGKYNKTLMYNENEVNYYFIFLTLRNLYIDKVRSEIKEISLQDYDHPKTIPNTFYYDKILQEVKEEIDDWHLYDRKIYELVFLQNKSIRQVSRETGIDYYSLYRTVKKIKKIIHSIIDK